MAPDATRMSETNRIWLNWRRSVSTPFQKAFRAPQGAFVSPVARPPRWPTSGLGHGGGPHRWPNKAALVPALLHLCSGMMTRALWASMHYVGVYLSVCLSIYTHMYGHPPPTRTPLKSTVNTDTNAAFFRIQFWICFYRLETQL